MPNIRHIRPCLWFDNQAEEAANYYVSLFKNSKITQIARYNEVGFEVHQHPAGSVMTVTFELDGHKSIALNGGPHFKFNEAISLEVECETQQEVDYFWEKLSAGGDPNAQVCGWLKDKYGLSWQVVPSGFADFFADHKSEKSKRAMAAMLKMKKLNIAELRRAVTG
jgi:predicted 3-demethylubiquinone-9 3-methyltransferase (glyoxalase superfamily)